MKKNETALFGGGCFWCTEAIFTRLNGVISVTPGYAGGTVKNPNYYDLTEGTTGHAEVIKIDFDPEIISYEDLLDIFWHTHNPTLLNQQDYDKGTEYRSIILYTTEAQKQKAYNSMKNLEESKEFSKPIVTEIKPLDSFYEAESYHKNYFEKNREAPYCQIIISPKIQKLTAKYSSKLKK